MKKMDIYDKISIFYLLHTHTHTHTRTHAHTMIEYYHLQLLSICIGPVTNFEKI